jgi:hypothetical protein
VIDDSIDRMMVIARDAVAADQLVYAWPLSIGPECEVACGDHDQVVMCPAWMVGDRLGPGRHLWRTPDPTRPVCAFFVRTTPVDCTFDMTTAFIIPATGQPVRLRATGALQVQCSDPSLLIAQFVGLPFDHVNDGILRSVSRSIERMLARLLTRRVLMAASPIAVLDPTMLPGIVEELVAYNPTAGAVFGVELLQITELVIGADDGSTPFVVLPNRELPVNGEPRPPEPEISLTETARGRPKPDPLPPISGELRPTLPHGMPVIESGSGIAEASGEILVGANKPIATPAPGTLGAAPIETHSTEDTTQPQMRTPLPGALRSPVPDAAEPAILGIGMSAIGSPASISGEINPRVRAGNRVLVPGPDGLMQSATVRQLLQGYYELEVGSSGETIWVPVNNVVPE